MSWLWGSRKTQDDDEDEYEEYTDDEEDEDGSYESYTDEEDEVGPDIVDAANKVPEGDNDRVQSRIDVPPLSSTSSGIHAEELALLTDTSPKVSTSSSSLPLVATTGAFVVTDNDQSSALSPAPTTSGAVVLDHLPEKGQPPPQGRLDIERHRVAAHDVPDELLAAGVIPSVVGSGSSGSSSSNRQAGLSSRDRLPSAISDYDDDYDDDVHDRAAAAAAATAASTATTSKASSTSKAQPETAASEQAHDDKEDEEEVTTLQDKQSLLVLAAEHDRVDILQAILSSSSSTPSKGQGSRIENAVEQQQRTFLLNPVLDQPLGDNHGEVDDDQQEQATHKPFVTTIPPLHIAVSYGSVNAVTALLRLGADPSLRPDVPAIRAANSAAAAAANSTTGETPPPDISHMQRFHDMTAWELAFGEDDNGKSGGGAAKSSAWSLFGKSDHSTSKNRKKVPVDMAPSKREGIRHAFTAEALRCIGSGDEVHRLQQLLDANMPVDTEIGGKTLWDWSVDMGATQCQALLQERRPSTNTNTDPPETTANPSTAEAVAADGTNDANGSKKSAVLDRGYGGASLSDLSTPALSNRLVELESLSQALSVCLDNLAEEVSVCAGLLLVGSGSASALATHVRSLKARQERKQDEWERLAEALENSEDELAYWVKQWHVHNGNNNNNGLSSTSAVDDILMNASSGATNSVTKESALPINSQNNKDVPGEPSTDAAEPPQQQHLRTQIEAMEHTIRRLRAAIADLSEENARNLDAVEKRGLSGGITLVRKLRDEIRDIEYQYAETQSAEAACRAKIRLMQAKVKSVSGKSKQGVESGTVPVQQTSLVENGKNSDSNGRNHDAGESRPADADEIPVEDMPDSERISRGHSTALVVRGASGPRGFLPFNIWQILLRIMGMSDVDRGVYSNRERSHHHDHSTSAPSSSSTPVMII